jgi:hypothetical protein
MLIAYQTCQATQWTKIKNIPDKAQEASYAIAEILDKKMKSHKIAESTMLSACCKNVNIMFGEEYEKEVLRIPMSDNTISRRIQNMSQDFESQVISNIREAGLFATQ